MTSCESFGKRTSLKQDPWSGKVIRSQNNNSELRSLSLATDFDSPSLASSDITIRQPRLDIMEYKGQPFPEGVRCYSAPYFGPTNEDLHVMPIWKTLELVRRHKGKAIGMLD